MSEWSTSLYYSAGDFFPGDEGDDEDEVVGVTIQQVSVISASLILRLVGTDNEQLKQPAPTAVPTAGDEEQVKFVETPL